MNCTESCDIIFLDLGTTENKRLPAFIFNFFIFSLEDALNILSSFLSDCARVSHMVHWGLWLHTWGGNGRSSLEKWSIFFYIFTFLMRYYKLGQTTGHVRGGSSPESLWLSHSWDKPLGLLTRGETDHLWMCGMSIIGPLFSCCNDSFKSQPFLEVAGVLLVLCGVGVLGKFHIHCRRWQRGAFLLLLCRIVLFQFCNILIHFYGCFGNEMQNRNLRGWIFVVFLVRVSW